MIRAVRQSLRSSANPEKAEIFQRFFKTGKGEYAEGDRFIGVVVPHIHQVAKQFEDLDLSKVLTLVSSSIHEERLLALLILVRQYTHGVAATQEQIVKAYLANLEY
ncbi:MAG: DNA alkylation repair protein [Nitrospirales bacterium]|nr:DNA alkylation repair protein [Nitrospirales bacterium]